MHNPSADFHRLTLLIQRILDADALCETKGARLLAECETAYQFHEQGNTTTARYHMEQVMCFTRILVRSNKLDVSDGHAVLETAHQLIINHIDRPAGTS